MGGKGQSSVELLIILSVVLVVLAFIYIASHQQLTESQHQVRISQARLTVSMLASAAREVYAEGPGARRLVTVTIPEGNSESRTGIFNESMINIGLFLEEGTSDVNELVPFRLVEGADFPKRPGTYVLTVEAFEGYVVIGNPSYTLQPGTIALELLPTDSETRVLNVTNYLNTTLYITLNLSWSNPNTTVNLNGSSVLTFQVAPNSSVLVNVNFASTNASLGTYLGAIYANTTGYGNSTVYLILQIVGAQPPVPTGVSYILIDTFNDSSYSTPSSVFDPTETVDIHGSNFTANSQITIRIYDSSMTLVHSNTTMSNSSGGFTYYWNPGMPLAPGEYNVTANDSTRIASWKFNITGCT